MDADALDPDAANLARLARLAGPPAESTGARVGLIHAVPCSWSDS
jgi:hypothetical protein